MQDTVKTVRRGEEGHATQWACATWPTALHIYEKTPTYKALVL